MTSSLALRARRRMLAMYYHRLRPGKQHRYRTHDALLRSRYCDASSRSLSLALVAPASEKDWVLGGICRQLQLNSRLQPDIFWGCQQLPDAQAYFLAHYSLLWQLMDQPRHLLGKILIYYTHPRDGICTRELAYAFNHVAHRVITMNSFHAGYLKQIGVYPDKITTIIGGADFDIFKPYRSATQSNLATIGFCVGFRDGEHYRERKDYDRLCHTIGLLSDVNVLLVGHNWREYERFGELDALPHFRYVEADYTKYPKLYNQMDVFVSLSRLEGGPVPVIEALACDVPVVATATGMCPDVVNDGHNGFLLPIDAQPSQIVRTITDATALQGDFRASVKNYSWPMFAKNIDEVISSAC